jgi:hypothetical protein
MLNILMIGGKSSQHSPMNEVPQMHKISGKANKSIPVVCKDKVCACSKIRTKFIMDHSLSASVNLVDPIISMCMSVYS